MASTNLTQFLLKYKANQQLALQASQKTINATLLNMYKRIVDRTPVGDPTLWKWPAHSDYQPGTLRDSWQLSFNGQQRATNGQFASTSQILETHGLSLKVGNSSKQFATISNPQPYAQRVENGWSVHQAPQGMMRVTVSEFTSIIDEEANKYRIR